jgi:hypothetical protein
MPDDTTAVRNAVQLLEELGVKFRRPSRDQLKIGYVNYYPNTGAIHVDGERRRRERGKEALMKLLCELADKNAYYVNKRNLEAELAKAASAPVERVKTESRDAKKPLLRLVESQPPTEDPPEPGHDRSDPTG